MIDLIKAQNEFKKYSQNYDMILGGAIEKKYFHSLRVMNISREIAQNLNLDDEQIDLATLIGLLHDIARFEEFTRYNRFSVKNKFDHADYALEILKKGNFIRKFIEDDKYDEIIYTAIENHNKFKIEDGLDEKTLMYCKIIRDADKIDIFYEATIMFWTKEKDKIAIEESSILDSYYEQFVNKNLIFRVPEQTILDELIVCIAFIFDINFKYSFKKIKSEDYINKIFNRFEFKNQETIERIKIIKEIVYNFINDNL